MDGLAAGVLLLDLPDQVGERGLDRGAGFSPLVTRVNALPTTTTVSSAWAAIAAAKKTQLSSAREAITPTTASTAPITISRRRDEANAAPSLEGWRSRARSRSRSARSTRSSPTACASSSTSSSRLRSDWVAIAVYLPPRREYRAQVRW